MNYINSMEPYTILAQNYDYLLRHVDYHEWYTYIKAVMHKHVPDPRLVLELGCGTGRFGAKFSADNYRIYGMDRSLEMLKVAKTRAYKNYRVFCADMTAFHVAQKPDFIFSVHDTMNYLLEPMDIRMALRSVRDIMHDRSVFMFDITTEYNIYTYFNEKTMRYSVRDTEVEWSNTYNSDKRHVHSFLQFRHRNGTVSTEEHVQRIHTVEEIRQFLKEEGFTVREVLSDYSFLPPGPKTIMINFIAGLNS